MPAPVIVVIVDGRSIRVIFLHPHTHWSPNVVTPSVSLISVKLVQ